jgi:hypothetical protein
MTWLRPLQGFGGGGGASAAGVGVAFVAKVATAGENIVFAGGAPAAVNGGTACNVGDVVLCKDQGLGQENGLYQVDVAGPGGTWTRIAALNTGTELETFFAVYVREGAVAPDSIYTLVTNPPYVIGVTPLSFALYPPAAAGAGAVLSWGNNSVAATTTTRFLSPWYEDALAQTAAIQWRVPRAGTLRNLRVRHNITAGNGNLIVYTVRVNGVATLLLVSLASTAADGSDLVNAVVVAAGDLVDVVVTKAASVGTSPNDIVADLEFS